MTSALERKPDTRVEEVWLRLLQDAPQRLVEATASVLARAKPLAPEPGWHFDVAAEDPSLLIRIRRDIWEYYREHAIERPVVLRWYDRLRVQVFLGNDMSLCLYVGGAFEPNEFVFLGKVLKPGMTVVDGGANDGIYSLFAARRVGPGGVVLGIEPSGREYQRLLANLALNPEVDVTAVRAALGRMPGEVVLAIAEAGHEGQNTIGETISNPKVRTAGHESVRMTTLDRLVDEHDLKRVDVVKLDVEGSEVDALLGGVEMIARDRPLLMVEAEEERLASQGRTKDELRSVLGELGYRLFVFDSRTGRLRPAISPDEPEGNAIAGPAGWNPP